MSTDDMIMKAASEAGKPHGMTGSEVLTTIAMAGRRHGDAADGECGEVSPFDEAMWCRREPDHGGSHFPWPRRHRPNEPHGRKREAE